eukprot:935746-Rhodomonas_salina.1
MTRRSLVYTSVGSHPSPWQLSFEVRERAPSAVARADRERPEPRDEEHVGFMRVGSEHTWQDDAARQCFVRMEDTSWHRLTDQALGLRGATSPARTPPPHADVPQPTPAPSLALHRGPAPARTQQRTRASAPAWRPEVGRAQRWGARRRRRAAAVRSELRSRLGAAAEPWMPTAGLRSGAGGAARTVSPRRRCCGSVVRCFPTRGGARMGRGGGASKRMLRDGANGKRRRRRRRGSRRCAGRLMG